MPTRSSLSKSNQPIILLSCTCALYLWHLSSAHDYPLRRLTVSYMQYHVDAVDPTKGTTYEKAKKFGQILIDNCMSRLISPQTISFAPRSSAD